MLSEFSVYSSIILQPCISNQETSNSSFMVLREEILVRGIQVAQQSDAKAAGTRGRRPRRARCRSVESPGSPLLFQVAAPSSALPRDRGLFQ